MTAAQILEMIEKVDPNDTAKLDEIDARVWCYLAGLDYAGMNDYYVFKKDRTTQCEEKEIRINDLVKYTRSRDALKAIRPRLYDVNIRYTISGESHCFVENRSLVFSSPHGFGRLLPTEELAELHAVIQAIDFERTKK